MTLRLNGSTSGYTEIDAPAVAGSNTVILPSGNGSANQFLKNGSTAGTLGWSGVTEDSSGNFAFNSGYGSVATAYACRAWVNFNGTGVVAIRASGNVSSISDNGVGDYTVNFTTAMPDANYSMTFGLNNNDNLYLHTCTRQSNATTSVQIVTKQSNQSGTTSFLDYNTVCIAIFR